jgi:hypothetical protein
MYLIGGEDDEVTGEKCAPSWEPKVNANQLAVSDWEAKKQSKKHVTSAPEVTPLSALELLRARIVARNARSSP